MWVSGETTARVSVGAGGNRSREDVWVVCCQRDRNHVRMPHQVLFSSSIMYGNYMTIKQRRLLAQQEAENTHRIQMVQVGPGPGLGTVGGEWLARGCPQAPHPHGAGGDWAGVDQDGVGVSEALVKAYPAHGKSGFQDWAGVDQDGVGVREALVKAYSAHGKSGFQDWAGMDQDGVGVREALVKAYPAHGKSGFQPSQEGGDGWAAGSLPQPRSRWERGGDGGGRRGAVRVVGVHRARGGLGPYRGASRRLRAPVCSHSILHPNIHTGHSGNGGGRVGFCLVPAWGRTHKAYRTVAA